MKLSTKYILFVSLLHLVALYLTWVILKKDKVYFIAAETVVILSLVIAARLYRELISPLKYLIQGIEAIKDRDFNVKFLPTKKHEVDQLIGVYNRMIDELRAERTRQEQQHFFLEKLIQTSPTGILILDHDDRVEHANPKAMQILGSHLSGLTGMLATDLPHPLSKQFGLLQNSQPLVVKPNGLNTYKLQRAHFIDRGFARQFIVIEDITAEISAVEKNVYCKVIRMMSHEVNNTVGPVNSIIQSALATKLLWETHAFNNLKDALRVAMDRNQNLNLFMRNFADLVKLPQPTERPIDLHKLLQQVSSFMSASAAAKDIRFAYSLDTISFIVPADEQLMEQALINIIKNGIDAIEKDGTIGFETYENRLIITDTGKGISEKDAEYLFSPFFSTKKDGQGIGLTLVREILLSHGFGFSLKTVKPGRTEFVIDIPER